MRASIPPFLMALMVGNGSAPGALRFAPTGIIVNKIMETIGFWPRNIDISEQPARARGGDVRGVFHSWRLEARSRGARRRR
jgi:hypothetical protein